MVVVGPDMGLIVHGIPKGTVSGATLVVFACGFSYVNAQTSESGTVAKGR